VTKQYGADVLRYWVASIDYTRDVQCSDEIMRRAADGYKKLRNTLRYLVANLPVAPVEDFELMPVDAWILGKSQAVFAEVHEYFGQNLFHSGLHKLMEYVNGDLSSIYLSAVKDRLYCSSVNDRSRSGAVVAMSRILRTMLGLIAPLFTHTAKETFSHCPSWFVGSSKDIFDFIYEPLESQAVEFDEVHWKDCLNDFHATFDRLKSEGVVRDTLECVLEGDFFPGAEDWFVVSDCREVSATECLAVCAAGRIVRSERNKCERCWKRNAVDDLCFRCRAVVA
jgi:isoleucyl-tRNA synthetase